MSTLSDLLKEIDSLREQLEKLKPIKAVDEERLWKKFRLEWNYNSNHIEGSTLTYGQTELLLMFDKTTGDHEMREYEEMKAHDAVIHMVKEYATDTTRELSESDIRQWNKTILVRPFWSDAQTVSGQPTKKKIIPGEYKKEPNSVRLQNGEMFHYASPEETPSLMNELVNWYRDEVKKREMHPVELAALLHYKFVRIHPFDDSNGRTSRLLMNYELLRNDLPPVIIKSADKKGYLFALNKADVGDVDAFVEYIGEQLKWSLELNVKAAKGEDIEDFDDLDKEISIWKRSLKPNDLERSAKSIELVRDFFIDSIFPLFEKYISKHKEFNDAFVENVIHVFYLSSGTSIDNILDSKTFFLDKLSEDARNNSFNSVDQKLQLSYRHEIYRPKPEKRLYLTAGLEIQFQRLSIQVSHQISDNNNDKIWSFYYSQFISDQEASDIIRKSIARDFEAIQALGK